MDSQILTIADWDAAIYNYMYSIHIYVLERVHYLSAGVAVFTGGQILFLENLGGQTFFPRKFSHGWSIFSWKMH